MKLNKVLPVFAIAGAVGVITPFLTSCAKYDFTYSNSQLNVKDLDLKTKQLTTAPESGKETNYYFEHIYNDHQILADDVANTVHQMWEEDKYSDINFSLKLVDNPNVKKHLLSFNITMNAVEAESKISYTNIYFIQNIEMQVNKVDSVWHITPKFLLLGSDDEKTALLKDTGAIASWKSIQKDGAETTTDEIILNQNTKDQSYLEDWSQIYNNLNLLSWYFGKLS